MIANMYLFDFLYNRQWLVLNVKVSKEKLVKTICFVLLTNEAIALSISEKVVYSDVGKYFLVSPFKLVSVIEITNSIESIKMFVWML